MKKGSRKLIRLELCLKGNKKDIQQSETRLESFGEFTVLFFWQERRSGSKLSGNRVFVGMCIPPRNGMKGRRLGGAFPSIDLGWGAR